jgi:outer membrane protein OmpA-like peptidoglycan-associated protein
VPGGLHRWGGTGPTGGGTHAAPDNARRRGLVLLGLVVVLAAAGLVTALMVSGGAEPAAGPGAAGAPATAPTPDPAVLQATLDEVLAATPLRFPADNAQPVPEAAGSIERTAAVLRATPGPPITVEGHTAPVGEETIDARTLSRQRAEEVARRLEAAGVPVGRLRAIGVGSARPLATLEASRRVEIRVG